MSWKNINFEEDPLHPLRPKMLQIMKTVYQHLDSRSGSTIGGILGRSRRLSYQIDSSNPIEPSIVILKFREGQSDSPAMDTHFMINLNTNRIHDKFKNERFPAPLEILGLGELRRFVRDTVKIDRER
jgi:hypothetical protein